ncbi:response regulator transcription factor [bacterium]|nr:response regulator transcription factor [bacterium]
MKGKTVLVADDFPVVGMGLQKILEGAGDFEFKGAAGSVYALRSFLFNQKAPDLIVVDSNIPHCDISELLTNLRDWAPMSNILLFCAADEEFTALLGLKKGVRGVISKCAGADEIVKACRTVAHGGTYVSGVAAEKMAHYISESPFVTEEKSRKPFLSAREFMVMRKLTTGNSLSQIARELNISPKTVCTYRERLMAKLGIKTLAGLIRYALQNDILADD